MLNERELTKKELEKREDAIMDLKANKRSFVKRYGKDAEKVMYGRATNIAKKQTENMNKDKVREMIMASLQGPVSEKKGKDMDGDGDVDSQDYLAARDAAIKKAKGEKVEEMDMNDPALMKFRATKDKLAKMRAANAGDDGNDKFFDSAKLRALKAKRAEIMRDMEQEAEPEGGPIANRYGDMLNAIDAEMAKEKAMMGLEEDMDLGHEDNEPHMLKADLYRIGKYAMELYQIMDDLEGQGEVDLPHWWQAKIINAKEALVGAKHYLDFEMKEPQIDAMVDVADDVEAIDEEMLDEGIIDTIKDKIASLGKKLLDKFSPEEQALMKAAAEKVLGPNYSKEDITLDKAKEIGKIISGDLDESQELDENLRKKIGGALAGLGMSTAFVAGNAFSHTDAGAITAGIGIVAAMIGMVMAMVDEAQESGETDKVASDIQKAMNKHKGDESKTYQLQQARKAMNKGDLDKAKKIAARLAEKLKS